MPTTYFKKTVYFFSEHKTINMGTRNSTLKTALTICKHFMAQKDFIGKQVKHHSALSRALCVHDSPQAFEAKTK
jgi:hypothetical protein